MIECVQPYYIRDGEILDCHLFQKDRIDQGRSIYEVLRLMNGRILFVEDHLIRLFSSLEMEGIKPWINRKDILMDLNTLIRENHSPDGNIKIVINVRTSYKPSFLAYFVAHRYPRDEDYENGVKTISFPFERIDPNKKLWRPDFRKQVSEALNKSGAVEALLLDSTGFLPEASKANVFAILGNSVVTAPHELILPGITRKFVIETCREMALPVIFRKIALSEMDSLDGVFLTGTSLHVLPVCSVDNYILPVDNEIMRSVMKQFKKLINQQLR